MRGRAEVKICRSIWWDGEFVDWEAATVHVLSHSIQRGSLIFDYMSAHETPRGTGIFRLREHVERLFASAELVGLPLSQTQGEIEAAIVETVRRNPGASAVKVSAFLPSIEVDVVPLDPRVSLAIAAYDPAGDIQAHKPTKMPPRRESARLWIEKSVKNRRPDIMAPQAKVAANYTSPMLAKWKARAEGYDEILLIDQDGCVAEGPTTNVFLVEPSGTLVTPSEDNVLLGVTRRTILDIAVAEGIDVREGKVTPTDLFAAKEVFLTGTTAGVWPVESIDGEPVGSEVPGPVASRLRESFLAASSGADPRFEHWLTIVAPA
jgi:branched-chain amino acid aminotransferase